MSLIPTTIGQILNKNISVICPFSIGKNSNQNHCAHYVSHMMGYELKGVTCKNFTWSDKQLPAKGATLRVDDIFKASPEVGALSSIPASIKECLIFVTIATNITKVGTSYKMGNHPRKHIGILTQGKVWNYSNTSNKVVADSLLTFQQKFSTVYKTAGTTVEFFYGKFL